jgi:hypothetical protein
VRRRSTTISAEDFTDAAQASGGGQRSEKKEKKKRRRMKRRMKRWLTKIEEKHDITIGAPVETDPAETDPTGTTVTLASNLVFTHPIYTKIQVLAYDQVEFSKAATVAGSKTVMATMGIAADSLETVYQDTTATSGYYFYRFKNSITTTYSDYSDPIPYNGFDEDTVEKAIKFALKKNKLNGYSGSIDFDYCIDEINSCLRYITGKLKR